MIVLQFGGLLFDYFPAWLGPALLSIGIVLLSTGVYSTSEMGKTLGAGNIFALLLMGVGSAFSLVPLYFQYPSFIIAVLTVLGRTVEGAAMVRTVQKGVVTIRERELQGGLKGKIIFLILGIAITVILSGVGVTYLILYKSQTSIGYSLQLIRTMIIIGLSVGAVGLRINDVRKAYSWIFYSGFILTIIGTELHNLQVGVEIAIIALGNFGYLLGTVGALYTWHALITGQYNKLIERFGLDYYTMSWIKD